MVWLLSTPNNSCITWNLDLETKYFFNCKKFAPPNDEYIIVKFSALNFVQLSIESEDSKLRNLSKALYLYSAASDAYNN